MADPEAVQGISQAIVQVIGDAAKQFEFGPVDELAAACLAVAMLAKNTAPSRVTCCAWSRSASGERT